MPIKDFPLDTYMQPLRQSSFSAWHHCRRYGLFRYRLCLHPRTKAVPKAAQLGTITHALLEVGPGKFEKALEPYTKQILEWQGTIESGEDMFGELRTLVKQTTDNINKARMLATVFHQRFPPSTTLKTIAREQLYTTSIQLNSGITIWLSGTLDTIYSDFTKEGEYWVGDYKTTSLPIDDFIVGYHFGPQKRFYRLLAAMWLIANGYASPKKAVGPKGFILNVLQTPNIIMCGEDRPYTVVERALKSGPRKGQMIQEKIYEPDAEPSHDLYLNRCLEWYAQEGVDPVRSYCIPYGEPFITPSFGDALTSAMMWSAADLSSQPLDSVTEMYPTDPTASRCHAYRRTCEYYPLCNKPCHAWSHIIDEQYEQIVPDNAINDKEIPNVDHSTPATTIDSTGHPAGSEAGDDDAHSIIVP